MVFICKGQLFNTNKNTGFQTRVIPITYVFIAESFTLCCFCFCGRLCYFLYDRAIVSDTKYGRRRIYEMQGV